MNDPIRSTLGLAMRAGKIVSGDEAVMKVIRNGQAKLVMIAEDAAKNARKKMYDKCNSFEIPIAEYGSREELGSSIGKQERVVIAVTDEGFAGLIMKRMEKPL